MVPMCNVDVTQCRQLVCRGSVRDDGFQEVKGGYKAPPGPAWGGAGLTTPPGGGKGHSPGPAGEEGGGAQGPKAAANIFSSLSLADE